MLVFVDLEDTVIDNWQDGFLLFRKCERIREILAAEKVKTVTIFSFAVWDNADRDDGIKRFEAGLKVALGVDAIVWLTVEEIISHIRRVTKVDWSRQELLMVWGKERGFFDFVKSYCPNQDVLLFDDMVANQTLFIERSTNTFSKIRLVNVKGW